MIYEITRELATALLAVGFPYRVVYGPERSASTGRSEPRIVVQRDRSGNDRLEAPAQRRANPRQIGVRWASCEALVFARSSAAGALPHEHERVADLMVDKLTVALHKVVRTRCNRYEMTNARFLRDSELADYGVEHWPGVVYRVEFAVDRGVFDTSWAEAAAPEATGVGVTTAQTVNGDDATAGGVMPNAATR